MVEGEAGVGGEGRVDLGRPGDQRFQRAPPHGPPGHAGASREGLGGVLADLPEQPLAPALRGGVNPEGGGEQVRGLAETQQAVGLAQDGLRVVGAQWVEFDGALANGYGGAGAVRTVVGGDRMRRCRDRREGIRHQGGGPDGADQPIADGRQVDEPSHLAALGDDDLESHVGVPLGGRVTESRGLVFDGRGHAGLGSRLPAVFLAGAREPVGRVHMGGHGLYPGAHVDIAAGGPLATVFALECLGDAHIVGQ